MNVNVTATFKKSFFYLFLSLYCTPPLLGITLENTAGEDVECAVEMGINQVSLKKITPAASWKWETDQDCSATDYCMLYCAYGGHDSGGSLNITPLNMYDTYHIVNDFYPYLKLEKAERGPIHLCR